MNISIPTICPEMQTQLLGSGSGKVLCITLNRAKAVNALSLPMVRALTQVLQVAATTPQVLAVVVRGSAKDAKPGEPQPAHFGHFCAGGDIRFFHQAALAGDGALDDFFAEEYALNHLIYGFTKPYIALMDGVVMGGGMGISQGARLRVVTERTKMAMPETIIGLFPDVGGGYFLSRCGPKGSSLGEYLALTGETLEAQGALAAGLADVQLPAASLHGLWAEMAEQDWESGDALLQWIASKNIANNAHGYWTNDQFEQINSVFSLPSVLAMLHKLESADSAASEWHQHTAKLLRQRSPLMLCVTLEQIRRARTMSLADDLRMELAMVHHCFHMRPALESDTVEGIRALAVDKDHAPKWRPSRVEDVSNDEVKAFFKSPWPPEAHQLRAI